MSTTTAVATIEQLRCMFAQHGIPETLVSDNGLQFMSDEFAQFCLKNGIHHVLVTPYHPSSNGLAETRGSADHKERYTKDGGRKFATKTL